MSNILSHQSPSLWPSSPSSPSLPASRMSRLLLWDRAEEPPRAALTCFSASAQLVLSLQVSVDFWQKIPTLLPPSSPLFTIIIIHCTMVIILLFSISSGLSSAFHFSPPFLSRVIFWIHFLRSWLFLCQENLLLSGWHDNNMISTRTYDCMVNQNLWTFSLPIWLSVRLTYVCEKTLHLPVFVFYYAYGHRFVYVYVCFC